MSGIFGYWSPGQAVSSAVVVEQMATRLRHLPHMVVETAAPNPELAVGRLGIGIFNRAQQPYRDAAAEVWLWFTGELYHQHQRRTALVRDGAITPATDDGQLALEVYLREGAEGLTRLEGAFIVAVWDARQHELVLINDRFGLYPHYVAYSDRMLAWAPEIKGVLCAPGLSREVDLTAVAEYVRLQQILGNKTWLRDIQLLPPASLLRFRPRAGGPTLRRYWDWDTIREQPRIGFNEAVDEASRLFQRAIDAMIQPPHRVGVYLSGGLDSRTILGFIDRQVPVTTLTYGAAGCRDVVYAEQIARRAGSAHHWFPFENGRWVLDHAPLHLQLTEGMHSWMHMHGISTLPRARQLIDVNLSGWDGGTVFGGLVIDYSIDHSLRHPVSEDQLVTRMYDAFCQEATWPGLTNSEAEQLFIDKRLNARSFESFRAEFGRTRHYPDNRRCDYFYIDQHDRRSTQNMIVFARSSIEVRCPFFDYDLINFLYSLPEAVRATPKFYRALLTRRAPQLATIPHEKHDSIPHENPIAYYGYSAYRRVINRVRRQLQPQWRDRPRLYADYENYLRTDLCDWAEGILFDDRTIERGLFCPDQVRGLWMRHLKNDQLWTIGKIAPLITTELVLRHLIDDGGEYAALGPIERASRATRAVTTLCNTA